MEWQQGMDANPQMDIYTSVYEDMKQDPVEGVARLNAHLGTGCSPQLCEDIAKACSFDKLQPYRDATMPQFIQSLFKEGRPTFYRKGQVGDWKNWFTVEMDEEFDEEYKKRMADYRRRYKYTLE